MSDTTTELHAVHEYLYWCRYHPKRMTIFGTIPYLYQAGGFGHLDEEEMYALVEEYIENYDDIKRMYESLERKRF